MHAGDRATVLGTLSAIRGGRGRWRRAPVTAALTDGTATINLAWFNQPYMAQSLQSGSRALCTGIAREYRDALQMANPEIELLDGEEADTWQPLLARYPFLPGISDRKLRGWIDQLLHDVDAIPDPLPEELRVQEGLPSFAQSMRDIHQPDAAGVHEAARRRFVFEEFLLFQVRVQCARAQSPSVGRARPLLDREAVAQFQRQLPFALTEEQRKVWAALEDSLASPTPANVLLQGDVGTGKTLLALQAALLAIRNGVQVSIMAPTEILVDQHAATVRQWLAPHGIEWTTLTGGLAARDRRTRREAVAAGDVPLVIGTHALFEEGVQFARLGLVIIDEQHRFGVLQRARLQQKGTAPHLIVMTATPIPRSLALTLYGEFDRLTLRERPAGRQPVITELLGDTPGKQWIGRVRAELDASRQAFWICPLVRASDDEEGQGGVSALEQFDRLRRGPLKAYRVGLLHGGMRSDEKTGTMLAFANGDTQVLVSTTVVEVGVDVPNASVMVIEDAHRFGLSQLHQLRGRLGRGAHPGLCLLRGTPTTEAGEARLDALASTTDGFEIAARDLDLRGPGDFLGVRQSGIPVLRCGHLLRDAGVMDAAAACARTLLSADPQLACAEHAALRERLGPAPAGRLWL